MDNTALLEMVGITKAFSGITVLQDVSFQLRAGEVHALLGENGAGKSTLVKILTGVYHKDSGQLVLNGTPVEILTPADAITLGIALIPQEMNLVPQLSVAENMYMGHLPRNRFGTLNWGDLNRQAVEVLQSLSIHLSPTQTVGDLSVAEQQMVTIAKALSMNASLLVMDEPTSALTKREVDGLFAIIRRLRSQGVSIIYISHLLEEIFSIADRVTVLRDGHYVATLPISEVTVDELITLMVGRQVTELYPPRDTTIGPVILEARGLARKGVVHDVSFALHRGEVLGLAGIVGAGRSEIARLLFGIDRLDGGQILLDGKPVLIRSPKDAIRLGIGFAPEDRKKQGLVLPMTVGRNLSLAVLARLRKAGMIDTRRERDLVQEYQKKLDIRAAGAGQRAVFLSGGNQQKVVMAKWLATEPRVLVLDEPTRGIDVGAKAEIRRLINELTRRGLAILLISSDLPEVINMSDRILVIYEGAVAGEFERASASPERIIELALGQGLVSSNGLEAVAGLQAA
jgi:ABC-type sugar transport system ATPase subunit